MRIGPLRPLREMHRYDKLYSFQNLHVLRKSKIVNPKSAIWESVVVFYGFNSYFLGVCYCSLTIRDVSREVSQQLRKSLQAEHEGSLAGEGQGYYDFNPGSVQP